MIDLLPGERLDDLQYKNLSLIQSPGRAFSADSVLLSSFCRLKRGEPAIDLGCGTGVLSTLITARTDAVFTAVDVDETACGMLIRSAAHNGQTIRVCCMDWREAPKALGHGTFRAAVSNPPYFERSGSPSPDGARAIARAGGGDALRSLLTSAAALLANGGLFFFCWPAEGLTDGLSMAREMGLEPKRLLLVSPREGKAPYLALIEAKKGGKPGLRMEPLMALSDEVGNPTAAMRRAYHMDDTMEPKGEA